MSGGVLRLPPRCDRMWSTDELCEFLGVPVTTLHQWRHRGVAPPAYKVGGKLKFDPLAVRQWLAESCQGERAG